jgi:hypothetical protein
MIMFHKKIETHKDAISFLKGGERANDILERLELLESLIEKTSQGEEDIEEPVGAIQAV